MASDHKVRLVERGLRAYLLKRVCALLGLSSLAYGVVLTVLGEVHVFVLSAIAIGVASAIGLAAAKRGLVTSTSVALLSVLATAIIGSMLTVGRQDSVASLVLFALLCGLLLGRRGAVAGTLVSITVTVVVVYLEATGVIVPVPPPPLQRAVTVSAVFGVVGVLLFWALTGQRRTLRGLVETSTTLDSTQRRYTELIHDLADGVVSLDLEGVILSVNPAIERMIKQPASDIVGRHFWTLPLISTASLPMLRSNFEKLIGGESFRDVEVHIEVEDEIRILEASPRLFRRAEGELEISATIRDVTERMKAAEELAQLEARLQESRRLEALGRLAGGIAHDFNNWLTLIVANAELLRDEIGENEELASISEAAHRSTALTHQLLTFARRQVTEPQLLEVASNIELLAPMLERMAGHAVTLTTIIETRDPVLIDPTQFEQVVMNLVLNAAEATDDGGEVELRAFTKLIAGQPWVCIDVKDDGPGVSPKQQAHLFEPFYTTKETGTGLGLATVHGVVTAAGGDVRLLPSTSGAHFRVRLPLADGEIEDAPTQSQTVGGRVLIVDDDDRVRRTVARVLERDFDIETAPSGAVALDVLSRESFDVVLSDIRMPQMSGTELLQAIRERHPDLPVILMSGYAQEKELMDSVEADAFIAKPFSPTMLREMVSGVLED